LLRKIRIYAKYVFATVLFAGGFAFFLYPTASRLINEHTQTNVAQQFVEDVEALDAGAKATTLAQAQAYNRSLVNNQLRLVDPFGDEVDGENPNVINFSGLGEVLATLEIPQISLKLPIYEGASEVVLRKGAGWLAGTSFPVGGESTHTVLSGHRGLPTMKLFSDIVKLEIGDEFFIRNTNEILAYRVAEIRIVEPEDVSYLAIIEGKDKATLLTCHPYMINSHRYLVTGERTEYTGQLEQAAAVRFSLRSITRTEREFLTTALVSLGLGILVVLVILRSRRKKKKKRAHNK
jgi:sortase A